MSKLKIFYGRVSTDQLSQSTSAVRQAEIGAGYDLVLIDYESGRDVGREKYTQLIDLIRAGQVELVTATRSDRIGRNAAEMDYFYSLCIKNGVTWRYIEEPQLNSDSQWGTLQRKTAAHEAEMESIKLGMRQEAAYRHAESKGRVIARIPPMGFRVSAEKKFEVDWLLPDGSNAITADKNRLVASGEIARRLIDLFLQHKTAYQSHRHWQLWLQELEPVDQARFQRLRKFRYESVRAWIQHPVVRGNMAYGRYQKIYAENAAARTVTAKYKATPPEAQRILYGTHAGLLTLEEAQEVDRIINLNKSFGFALAESRRPETEPATLSPILRCECGKCVNATTSKQRGKTYRYYYCATRPVCPAKGISEPAAIEQIIALVTTKAEDLLALSMQAIAPTGRNPELEKLQREREKVLESYRATGMSIFLQAEKELTEKIQGMEQQSITPPLPESMAKYLQVIREPDFWRSIEPVQRADFFRKALRNARLSQGRIVSVDLVL